MTELRLSNDRAPEPEQNKEFRIVMLLVATAAALLLLLAILGFRMWSSYSLKFNAIDHSADSLTAKAHPPALDSSPRSGYQMAFETVYKNEKSGVTLRLPGMWRNASAPQISKPDAAHRFCILVSQDGLDLMFWRQFPDFLPSLDADADVLRRNYVAGGFILRGQRDIEIRGGKAKELRLFAPSVRLNLNLVIFRKWPVRYLLAVTGSPQAQAAWDRLENSLPQGVEIQ